MSRSVDRRARRPGRACVMESLEDRALFTVPAGFAEERFANGLTNPTSMTVAPDGRIFVAEQRGTVRVVKDGQLLSTPFASLSVQQFVERGLIGIEVDPNFTTNRFLYVQYTVPGDHPFNRVSRLTADGDKAVPGSEKVIFENSPLGVSGHHNGGAMHFGVDGKLYITTGESNHTVNAQSLDNTLGKVLRINSDGSIPTDNPFYDQTPGKNRAIYALGLRNPFTFAIDPKNGRTYVNDVGNSAWEEVNNIVAGKNYGWPIIEGPRSSQTPPANYVDPIHAYRHTIGCSVTGGVFYESDVANFPSQFVGQYFFSDLCGKWVHQLDPATNKVTEFASNIQRPVDLDIAADGSMYVLSHGRTDALGEIGFISRIRYTGSAAPVITSQPDSQTATVGKKAAFDVLASGNGLKYQWQRNGVNIAGATSRTYTTAALTLADDGAQFRVIVTNASGQATSKPATLHVTTNRAPTAKIGAPAEGSRYAGGKTISFAGSGTDPEDGALAKSNLTWQVDFHHDDHIHPFMPATSGISAGSFVVPTEGETADDVFFRIILTATDSQGLTSTTFRDVQPRKSTFTVKTSVAGLAFTIDGTPQTKTFTDTGVIGILRDIGVTPTQTLNGQKYEFVRWSDGGAATHSISTPTSDTTYTAEFRKVDSTGGNGLKGTYYDNADLSAPKFTRVDPTINFDWGAGSPGAGIKPDTFSVRWTGQIQPQFSETYTFATSTDDGVRLWIDGKLLIDHFTPAAGDYQATISLQAGKRYDVRMEMLEATGGARAQLYWQSASTPVQIVPTNRLFIDGTTSTQKTLAPVADAYARDGSFSAKNFGDAATLEVKRDVAGWNREAFLKFDLSGVTSIASAKLRLFGRLLGDGSRNIATGVFASADTGWNEPTLNWNNRPAASGDALAVAGVIDETARWYEWDLSDYLRDQKAKGKNVVTLVLRNLAASVPQSSFNSSEAAANRPELLIS